MKTSQDFLNLACQKGVLRFGEFKTKAGRLSPYFFNAGLFDDGESFGALCTFYARTILGSSLSFDMLFGSAYKGIPLVAGVAMRLAELGRNVPFAFNRKEAKDHGEGGMIVGAPLKGRVLILDDVISAGTSVREAVDLIHKQGATPAGVMIALDRMERGQAELSAVKEIQTAYNLPVVAVATLEDLLTFLTQTPEFSQNYEAVKRYRVVYGTN